MSVLLARQFVRTNPAFRQQDPIRQIQLVLASDGQLQFVRTKTVFRPQAPIRQTQLVAFLFM